MPASNIKYQTYTDKWLDEGHYLGIEFKDGMWVVQVHSREPADIDRWGFAAQIGAANVELPSPIPIPANTPLTGLAARLAARTAIATAEPVQDTTGRYYLVPDLQTQIFHVFWGGSPGEGMFYFDYPSRIVNGGLLGNRPIGGIGPSWLQRGKIGVKKGDDTPIDDPDPTAEFFSVFNGPWPEWWVNNPTGDTITPVLGFKVMKYTFIHVRDTNLLREFLTPGGRRIRLYTIGPIPANVEAPDWLKLAYKTEFAYTKALLGGGS